ncbi:GerMN domain-containing protein [Desulfatiferula olefinivorans]
MTGKTRKILVVSALVPGLAAVVLFWVLATNEAPVPSDSVGAGSAPDLRYAVESPVYLYFQDRHQDFLSPEERLIVHPGHPVDHAATIIRRLIEGPRRDRVPTLPSDTRLRTLFIHDQTAYVDFSREIRDHHPGGVQTEHLTIVSIVNSLVLNVPEIKRVKILIDGRERDTLAGHIDIRGPLAANMLLVR